MEVTKTMRIGVVAYPIPPEVEESQRVEWLVDRASELGLTCLPLPGPALASAGADYLKHLRELGESRNIEFESGPWAEPEQTAELVENGRRWAEALKAMGGESSWLSPEAGGNRPPTLVRSSR